MWNRKEIAIWTLTQAKRDVKIETEHQHLTCDISGSPYFIYPEIRKNQVIDVTQYDDKFYYIVDLDKMIPKRFVELINKHHEKESIKENYNNLG